MTTLTADDLKRNQNLLLYYFLYTTFHGALRKWVFGSSGINNMLLMVQLIAPFIVFFLMKREKSLFTYQPLFPLAVALAAFALNPMNATLFHGILGFILHFGFWLLMVTYLYERDAFPLENIIKIIVIVCIAESLLTFIQFALPPGHILNRYDSADDAVAGFEDGGVRVIGTFSYIAGYGSLLFFTGLFAWALMVESKRSTLVILGVGVLGLVSAFMNGSRSIVLPLVLCLIFGFVSYGTFSQKLKTLAVMAAMFVLGIALNLGNKVAFVEKAYAGFSARVTNGQKSGEANYRTLKTFERTVDFHGKYPLFGIGLGATYQGSISKWGKSRELIEYGYCEEEPERILIEGGYFLLLIRIGLFVFLAIRLRIPIFFSATILFYIFFFTIFVFNTYQMAYVFFGLAILDKIYGEKELLEN